MPTVTKFANANSVVTTGWTSPTNAYANDGVYATATPGKNSDITSDFGFPAFTTSDIPAGSTINSITIEIVYKSSNTASTGALIGIDCNNGGTLLGETTFPMTLTNQTTTQTYSSGVALSDLQTANNLKARIRANRARSNTGITWSLDYVKLTVDYTAATTYTDAPSGAASATGTNTDSWVKSTIYTDAPTGSAVASGSLTESHLVTYTDAPSGAASASGSIADAHLYSDTRSGVASSTGSITESWITGSVYTDSPVGSANSLGSMSEAHAYTDSSSGSATSGGSTADSLSRSGNPTGGASASGVNTSSTSFQDSPTGAASAAGSNVDSSSQATNYTDAPVGNSSASGSILEGVSYTDASSLTASAQGSAIDSLVFSGSPNGSASSAGHSSDSFSAQDNPVGAGVASGWVIEYWDNGQGPPPGAFLPGKCQGKSRFKAVTRGDDWWT